MFPMGLIREIQRRSIVRRLKITCIVGDESRFLPGFGVSCQGSLARRIEIGNNSIISSKLFFESSDSGNIKIGNRCHLGGGTKLISRSSITIGDDVTIAWDCTIYDHDSHPLIWDDRRNDTIQELLDLEELKNPIARKNWSNVVSRPIRICDRAWLGFGVTVLKGVTIGEGAVVGAMSVVTKDIPPYCIAAGNPARVIRKIETERRDAS